MHVRLHSRLNWFRIMCMDLIRNLLGEISAAQIHSVPRKSSILLLVLPANNCQLYFWASKRLVIVTANDKFSSLKQLMARLSSSHKMLCEISLTEGAVAALDKLLDRLSVRNNHGFYYMRSWRLKSAKIPDEYICDLSRCYVRPPIINNTVLFLTD